MTTTSPVEPAASSSAVPGWDPGTGHAPEAAAPRRPPRDRAELSDQLVAQRSSLVAYLTNQLSDRQLAEDLAHEVLASALAHLDDIDPQRPLWPWLITIARNQLIDHYRRTGTAQELGGHPRVCEALSPSAAQASTHEFDDPGTRMGEHELLDQAMRPLTSRQRSALLLHDVHGWSSEQIAALHGRNRNAVHQLIYRARNRVRHEYERLSGDKGAMGVLPWPFLWAGELFRRAGARTRRSIQEWQLALSAFGESMAGVAVVASLSLGAGAMWATDSAEVTGSFQLTDLSDADLVASARAAAPQLGSPESTTTGDVSFDEQQRLAAAISEAGPEALEAQRAAEEAQAEAADAEESDTDLEPESDERRLSDAADSVDSSEASVQPNIETTKSNRYDDGRSVDIEAKTDVDAGTVEGGQYVEGSSDWDCDHSTSEPVCQASETTSEDPSPNLLEETVRDATEDASGGTDEKTDDAQGSDGDSTSEVQERTSGTRNDAESIEVLPDDDCGPDDAIGTVCKTTKSVS